ncbi:MAG: RNA polymerase factor sigma-54 [Bacteroidaceae bacterium]|nr:RNA polymerase factor sigma-54 [Bacteroidaceae bacterium]
MDNKQGQSTIQVQTQTQQLTPQQVLLVRLTELPLNDLRERIDKELEDNPWLQGENAENQGSSDYPDEPDFSGDSENSDSSEAEERPEPAAPTDSSVLYDDEDDRMPRDPNGDDDRRRELSDTSESFFDYLVSQLGEYDLDDHEREVMKYLIGSLADDGLLRVPLQQIADEMDIYQNIETNPKELERLLVSVLQQMDPAGVGARNLQECLTLQAKRNYRGQARDEMLLLFQRYWDDFSHLRWKRIQQALKLDDLALERLRQRIQHLNPRPGGSLGGDHSDNHVVTPDFIVETDENGQVHFTLNEGDLPRLTVSPDAEQELKMPVVSKSDREALRYLRMQVGNAQMFIDAIAQRRDTMIRTMKAIIHLQRPFFLEGDETLLRPMKLEDVAELTGQDISTVSRVSNSKYVQTNHGIYPLRWFFTSAAKQNGDDVTVRKILKTLREVVAAEDKRHPLSDLRLMTILQERGYDVARRTIAKYRTQLGIPESRLRRG